MEKIKAFIRNNLKLICGTAAFAALLVVLPLVALAQDAFPLPEADPVKLLLSIVTNWKAMGVLGVISGLTLLSGLAVNAWAPATWKWKRLTILGVSIVYSGIAAAMAPEGSAFASVMGVLITGLLAKGGASEIYEALKGAGVIKKK